MADSNNKKYPAAAAATGGGGGGFCRSSALFAAASFINLANIVVMLIAFCTAHWLHVRAELGAYGKKQQHMGLWQFCYSSSSRYTFREAHKQIELSDLPVRPASDALAALVASEPTSPLEACHWLGQFDFWYMRDFLHPPFFVVAQILFTMALALLIANVFIITRLWLGRYGLFEHYAVTRVCITNAISCVATLSTVLIFAWNVYVGTWLNDWSERHVSWSYAVAVAGFVLSLIAATLFGVLAFQVRRRQQRQRPLYAYGTTQQQQQQKNSEKQSSSNNDDNDANVQLLRYNAAAGEKV